MRNNYLESYLSFDNRIINIKEYIYDIRVDLEDSKHNEINNNNILLNFSENKTRNYIIVTFTHYKKRQNLAIIT